VPETQGLRRNRTTPIRTNSGATRPDVERQQLRDEGGADVGLEHDRERRHRTNQPPGGKAHGHQPGRRAALQDRRHAKPGEESPAPIAERVPEKAA